MKKLPKVGDKVKLKEGSFDYAGLSGGQIGTVTAVSEKHFTVNNCPGCFPHYWIKMIAKKKAKVKTYIISKHLLEALSNVPGTMGDEVEVKVIS